MIVPTKEILEDLIELANKYTLKNPNLPLLDDSDKYNPFVKNIDEKIANQHIKYRTLMLPNFHGSETVAVFSDYGGEHKGCKYHTYSFLFCTFEFLNMFNDKMKEIRTKYNILTPYKEIAFKDLSFGPLKAALPEILKCANNFINGLVVTIVVDKRINQTFGLNIKEIKEKLYKDLENNGLNVWKDKVFEKLLYIINTICYFTKLLSKKDQKFLWMTDNDAIIASKVQEDACMNILQRTLNFFVGDNYFDTIGYAKPFDDNSTYDITSLLSLPDLVAGALADYFQNTDLARKPMVSKDETDLIMDFISRQGILLKKYSMMFNYESDTTYKVGSLAFQSTIQNSGISLPVNY